MVYIALVVDEACNKLRDARLGINSLLETTRRDLLWHRHLVGIERRCVAVEQYHRRTGGLTRGADFFTSSARDSHTASPTLSSIVESTGNQSQPPCHTQRMLESDAISGLEALSMLAKDVYQACVAAISTALVKLKSPSQFPVAFMTKFPLERPPFPHLRLVDSDKENLLQLTDMFLLQTMDDYEQHLYHDNGIVDSRNWVQIKQFENIVVYEDRHALKERRLSRVSPSRAPKRNDDILQLLWSGTILGNLDDVMLAVVNRTTEEAKVKAAYIESNVVDFAVLDTLMHPTIDDPFRGVQVKWAVNAGPPIMRSVVRCRDFVYVESTGMTTTSTGERTGFQLLHSVTIPAAPELHQYKLVRGNMSLHHFFRQKSAGVVETYVKAFIDLMGDMPLRVATTLSTSGVVSVWKLGEYALMKKLNWLLSQRRAIVPVKRSDWCSLCEKNIRGNMVRRRACKICMTEYCARCCVPKKMFFVPAHSRVVVQKAANVCKDCIRTASYANGVDIALDELERVTVQCKAYAYWSTASPTSSTSSMML